MTNYSMNLVESPVRFEPMSKAMEATSPPSLIKSPSNWKIEPFDISQKIWFASRDYGEKEGLILEKYITGRHVLMCTEGNKNMEYIVIKHIFLWWDGQEYDYFLSSLWSIDGTPDNWISFLPILKQTSHNPYIWSWLPVLNLKSTRRITPCIA